MTESIRRELLFLQPRDTVWQALTDRAALAEWMMPNDFEPRVGHRFTFQSQPNPAAGFDGTVRCEVLECSPPERLSDSWAGGALDSQVTYRLESEGDGTRVYFEHAGFDLSGPNKDAEYRGADMGWTYMHQRLEGVVSGIGARS